MAARNRTYQTEKTREKIKVGMAIQRLQDHLEGKIDLSPTQVKSAQVLLAKTLPDLTSADIHDSREPQQDYSALIQSLKGLIGEDMANTILAKLGKSADNQVTH